MKSSIYWFANNPVAANLFMLSIFILGIVGVSDTRKELIPNISLERISIQTALAGAPVETVEKNICKPIEDRIYDIQGTQDLMANAYEGVCAMTVDIADGYEIQEVIEEIKNRLESNDVLPKDASIPEIKELNIRNRVAKLILSGNASYETLTKTARKIRKELLNTKKISVIDLEDIKSSEIKIEISSYKLQKYNLSLEEVGRSINRQSQKMSGGTLKIPAGEVLVVAGGGQNSIKDFSNMRISSDQDGVEIVLGDLAEISDNRVSSKAQAHYDGYPALSMDIYRVGDQNIMSIADTISNFVGSQSLPSNLTLSVWQDDSKHFSSRIDLLLSNAVGGLFLLFVILLLFLNFHLSFWVSLGIPVAFLGSLMTLPVFDVSINIISLFAFILVLGIVVDDAIVVGESIYEQAEAGKKGVEASLAGVLSVYKPVLFAVITSIIAFLPLLFLPGPEGMLMRAIPIVVIGTLLFSLFESLFILPAHLGRNFTPGKGTQTSNHNSKRTILSGIQNKFDHSLNWFVNSVYQPLLVLSLKNKGTVLLFFCMAFCLLMIVVASGWIKTSLFSAIEGDKVVAHIVFPEGTHRERTEQAVIQLDQAAQKLIEQHKQSNLFLIDHVYSVIAPKNKISNLNLDKSLDHKATVTLALSDHEGRTMSGQELINQWRDLAGPVVGVSELNFNASLNPAKPDIDIELAGEDLHELEKLADTLKTRLTSFAGVYDIRDTLNDGKQQANLVLKERSKALNISLDQIVKQVNLAFEGSIVQTIHTHDDEVDVRLGLPENEQSSIWYLENLPILLSDNNYASLGSIVDIEYYQSKNKIRRFDRRRVISVSAFVNKDTNSVAKIQKSLSQQYMDELVASSPGVTWGRSGQQKSINMFLNVLSKSYLIAVLAMYLLMAILFSSYSQPLLVLFAIPFGLVGSIVGHMIFGLDLTLWSFVGMVAVSGVVVNDNLVLIDYVNKRIDQGVNLFTAVCEAGKNRFRPILLTSLTTFMGLAPLILEKSIQAQFLIPMAVSLAFGVLFATVISLFLVPSSYLILHSWKMKIRRLSNKYRKKKETYDSVDDAYTLGFDQGNQGKKSHQNPYSDEVLHSSWEAGWHDAKNNYKKLYNPGAQ